MTPTRSDALPDTYLYDIPIMERHNLCQMLLNENVWQELAIHMGYDKGEIDDIKRTSYQTNDLEAAELLTRWGDQNHTVTELFVLLSRIKQYPAMNTIKSLVDPRYHRLIAKSQLTDSKNLNDKDITKVPLKHLTVSEKILNAPMLSNENNETDHLRNDKQSHGDKLDVNECAKAIPKIDYEELRDATNNWSEKNVLGKGGFGTVFKGMWKCTSVAIKRIEHRGLGTAEQSKIQMQQSLNELRHLNSCRHDNILPLYGYSVNGDDPCLVYQLMQGGSLEQRLFKRSGGIEPLTWQQRINIAVGTARGLQYLHTFQDNKKPLIHGDIKPANILLDPCNQPKIGDFGLAREGNRDETIVSRPYGTKPYLPAEFLLYRILSTKLDSYSFGIVLFELATGLRAYDNRTKSYLIKNVESHLGGKLLELIDKSAPSVEDMERTFNTIVDLGINCTKEKPEERLDMVKVLTILQNSFHFTT